jgi:cytochrome c-type biogenesis protein CcmH
VLGALVVVVIVWAAWPSGPPSNADRATAIAKELRCPDCESLSAADSQTASARAIRRDVKERIAEGQSDSTIRRAYVDRYGESILLEPEKGGLGLIVWGLPVLLLLVGAGALLLAFRRWRGTEPLKASAADEQLVQELRSEGRSS